MHGRDCVNPKTQTLNTTLYILRPTPYTLHPKTSASAGLVLLQRKRERERARRPLSSPEESYHYRFYQLAADGLPITPISYHPHADNTILVGRTKQEGGSPLPSEDETTGKVLTTPTCTSRPEYGLGCLICAIFARQRCQPCWGWTGITGGGLVRGEKSGYRTGSHSSVRHQDSTQGSSWWYLEVNSSETLSIFKMAPRTT